MVNIEQVHLCKINMKQKFHCLDAYNFLYRDLYDTCNPGRSLKFVYTMKIINRVSHFFLNNTNHKKTRFPSFLDVIAGSAGGGAIILGLIILILVLVNRSVLL